MVNLQGWRLDIPQLPRLKEVGSVRGGGSQYHDGSIHLIPQGATRLSNWQLSPAFAETITSLLSQVPIPLQAEIDLPGHTVSMIAAYPELGSTGVPVVINESGYFEVLNINEHTFEVGYVSRRFFTP